MLFLQMSDAESIDVHCDEDSSDQESWRFKRGASDVRDGREKTMEPALKKAIRSCEALDCKMTGDGDQLRRHWTAVHQAEVLLYLCPFPKCGAKSVGTFRADQHIGQIHKPLRETLHQIQQLPRLCSVAKNKFWQNPGPGHVTARPDMPEGCRPPTHKRFVTERLVALLEGPKQNKTDLKPRDVPVPKPAAEATPPATATSVSPKIQTWAGLPTVPDNSATADQLQRHLLQLDGLSASVGQQRAAVVRRLDMGAARNCQRLEDENVALRTRNRYLEVELARVRAGRHPLPTVVGDLQRITSTRGLVLYPSHGQLEVFPLAPMDYSLLDLENRIPCLSSEQL
jgi:hypothetical protein